MGYHRLHRTVALAAGMAVLALAGFARDTLAQAYPTKPVRIVVPFAPGGRVDVIARASRRQHERRVRASPSSSTTARARAARSARTTSPSRRPTATRCCSRSAGTHAILPNVDRKLPYDSVKDFTPIANLVEGFTFIGAHPSLGDHGHRRPREARQGQARNPGLRDLRRGTYGHFAGELLEISTGVDLVHVAYKGSGPALNDIAAGHVPLMIAGELVELAKAGKVRITGHHQPAALARAARHEDDARAGLPAVHAGLVDRPGRPRRACLPISSRSSMPPPEGRWPIPRCRSSS